MYEQRDEKPTPTRTVNRGAAERIMTEKALKEQQIMEWMPAKIKMAHYWIENEKKQLSRKMVRGAIHFCHFGENVGCEQNEERPVVIISNNTVNSTSGNVIVIPLTKNLKAKTNFKTKQPVLTRDGKPVPRFQSHYFLFVSKYGFLAFDSAAKTEETTSVSKIRLKEHLGNLDEEDINRLENRMKWTLGL
ncbi:mRNA interferase MazF [Paenibacillus shirakamiensis]|uniref:mRNA interferase MazF n=1 Tax=Paenibacillus shirakamiensis TaxID=1265935 RepID=A0ABS4JL64_9BACL|nr:type II toxin-antitoxin system PemK/MazF family toxin [Paenibacillus shirakamiensis]MBP2002428.1 mRNA interferase MazF [Paenibacillus shirakamiensis]